MSIRTDLALEAAQNADITGTMSGITKNSFKKADLSITEITVDSKEAAERLSKPQGTYITISSDEGLSNHPDNFNERVDAIAEELLSLIKKDPDFKSVLIVGLGNTKITPDSLGPRTAEQVFATRHIKKLSSDLDTSDLTEVSVIRPGVLGCTGIESSETVKAICDRINPSAVIAIDALACSEAENLGCTVQISDTGISPGSGVENARSELSRATLGVKVISLGVPTVIDMQTISEHVFQTPSPRQEFSSMMVTPREIDKLVMRSARLIAMAVNKAFQPSLTIEDITSLVE